MSRKDYKGIVPSLVPQYNFLDKDACVNNHVRYMLARTQSMFRYTGLPKTVPQRDLELLLQCNGFAAWAEADGALYAFYGGLGGTPDPYNMPTVCVVSNPALKFNKTLEIGNDTIIMKNDSMYMGLLPLHGRYATAMVENEISMKMVTQNSRSASLISAADDKTKASAELYIKSIEDGKTAVIGENAFLDGVRAQPYGTSGYTNSLISLIEQEQYLKASWWNEIGLNANWNSKREAIGANESALNTDMLLPLVDDMLKCRREALEAINSMFGTDITVELASSWEDNAEELEAEQDIIEEMSADTEMEVPENEKTESGME